MLTAIPSSGRDAALTLKTTPPRGVRGFIDREHLRLERLALAGTQVIALLAPSGFGKTSQLAQWRREALARGSLACWFSADGRDEPLRLIQGLAHSTREATGRRGFGDAFFAWLARCTDAQEAATGWLAEVAELSLDMVLLIDDVELLPTESRSQVLSYLLGNAPPNLTVALAARSSSALLASGALSPAAVTRVLASDLRLRPEETAAMLSAALGSRCNADAAVRLHEITEGWPLGVQLAIGALHRGGDLDSLVSAASSDIQRYFVDAVIDRQSADAVHLLVRLARWQLLHPQLCAEVLGDARFAELLLRLQQDTPLLLRAEGESWMRLHPLAREVLAPRLAQLPADERRQLSRKASAWYAARELYEDAADQAFQAGDVAEAIALVERSTDRMTVLGRSNAVLSWYERLSEAELRERPAFWAPAAWALAMSERHAEAEPLLDLVLAQPGLPTAQRFEAMLIGATAACFADRPDVAERLLADWPEPPSDAQASHLPIFTDARANLVLVQGQPDQARLMCARIGRLDRVRAYSPVSYGFADYVTGLAFVWEGRGALAQEVLRPALARAEERMGRTHPVACMQAAVLAQACWECGIDDEPLALLAGRTDTLERYGLPEALMAAWCTLARMAEHEGRQAQALTQLEALRALGQQRAMLRPQALAQAEIARLHARYGRADMARGSAAELEALLRSRRVPAAPVFTPWLQLQAELARARALLAGSDDALLPQALQAAEAAAGLAGALRRHGDAVQARLLRAQALRRSGSAEAAMVQDEAISLAEAEGMLRLLQEHGVAPAAPVRAAPAPATAAAEPAVRGASLLTAKEREVLALMNRNLSNKEIALAMSVGEQTVKWHVKNVFHKLNAANRKHAVARARLLGLIDD